MQCPICFYREDPAKSYQLTRRHNLVAVITDGSAVLGLGDIGPEASRQFSAFLRRFYHFSC